MLNADQRLQLLEPPRAMVDIVIDADAYNEIDDQFAIAYALRSPERLNVRAIYAAPFLNARVSTPAEGMEKSYQEIVKLLRLAELAKPAFRGATDYLPDEGTPSPSDAARDLAARAMGYTPERPLYVVALGAITNVASALLMNPGMAERVVVVWLGGNALAWPHNREFNIRQDVAAARVVLASGAPLVLLPCFGVVSAFTTTEPELRHWLGGRNALCDYLVENTVSEAERYAKGHVWSRVIWDATAVGWLMNDDDRFMQDRLIPTPVPEYDHRWRCPEDTPTCRYVYHIKRDALFEDIFTRLARQADVAAAQQG